MPMVATSLVLASASNTAAAAAPSGNDGASRARPTAKSAGVLRRDANKGARRIGGRPHAHASNAGAAERYTAVVATARPLALSSAGIGHEISLSA